MSAAKTLGMELRVLEKDPLEGVLVKLAGDGDNLFKWEVALFGPPDTIYTGGYFKAHLEFPDSYPFNPPKMTFLDPVFHPNVYPTGALCISILHPPGEDATSGERPEERWNPTQSVKTILLSAISLLNEPNTSSPANVDASVSYRAWKEGKSMDYKHIVERQVARSRILAEEDGVRIPMTVEDYVIKHQVSRQPSVDWMHDADEYDEDTGCCSDDGDDDPFDEDDEENGEQEDGE